MEKYTGEIKDGRGNAIPGASVRILNIDLTQATIYASDGGLIAGNPVVTDINGTYAFYGKNGKYIEEVTVAGVKFPELRELTLYDPVAPILHQGFTPIQASSAPLTSLFVDAADGKLKFRNAVGIVSLLY